MLNCNSTLLKDMDVEINTVDSKNDDFNKFELYCKKFKSQINKRIFYCRGPGSLTSMKLTHIFLHSLRLSLNLSLLSANCFKFIPKDDKKEVAAFNNMSFFLSDNSGRNIFKKENVESKDIFNVDSTQNDISQYITIKKSENPSSLKLPNTLNPLEFYEPSSPIYVTPFV